MNYFEVDKSGIKTVLRFLLIGGILLVFSSCCMMMMPMHHGNQHEHENHQSSDGPVKNNYDTLNSISGYCTYDGLTADN